MKDVVEKIKSNERLPAILKALADASPEDIKHAHQVVDDNDVTQMGILISSRLNVGGVDATLAIGGLLFFYQRITDCEQRRGLSDNMLEDLFISKSQAYRTIAVWHVFGKLLIDEPELKGYFVVEALKVLSGGAVDPMAREAAIAMARRREKVRIAQAEKLVAKFEPAEKPAPAIQSKPKRRLPVVKKPNSIWEYAGKAVRFILRPTECKSTVNHEAIIADLEAALALYRRKYARANAAEPMVTTGMEVNHV